MVGYRCLKRIESEDGLFALEVFQHPEGHAQFRVHQRHSVNDLPSGNPWTLVQDSRVYDCAESAEREGLVEWARLPQSRFSGMTPNERLSDSGLMGQWDQAVQARDRTRLISILARVDLGDQAIAIADSVLQSR